MCKYGLKLCSLLVVAAIVANMLPLKVFATQIPSAQAEQSITNAAQAETTDISTEISNHITEEIADKRTEYTKQFLLNNGLYIAAVYNEPVHYATDSGWAEIDNTLKVHSNGTYTNTAGIWDVSFPTQLTRDNKISVTKDGYTLSFGMAGELRTNSDFEVMALEDPIAMSDFTQSAVAEPLAAIQMQTAVAQLEAVDVAALKAEAAYPEMVADKLSAGLLYNNIYGTTDVRYELQSNTVKESVIIENYSSTLRGYQYALDVGQLIPVLQEDGSIHFYEKESTDIVIVMAAPFLVDAAKAYNDDVQVQLRGSGSSYTLTYLLPTQWLAAEERVWPVVLDPVVTPPLVVANICDRSISENATFSQTWGYNSCGYFVPEGAVRFYLKFDNLPNLAYSDVIIHAQINMYKVDGTDTAMPVYVHKVLNTWKSETITWAGQPGYNETIEDYAIVQANGPYVWDVTDIARGWYEGENTGMMFKGPDSVESAQIGNYKQFYSSDWGSNIPSLLISYRNNNGLESYWDYTSFNGGRAGTGYVNNYTGNLVWTHSDIGFGGNRMPVSISHIYNSNDAADNGFGLGYGWRTNYNQTLSLRPDEDSGYIWEDADGTEHYFERESNGICKDEDGLELTLYDCGGQDWFYYITDKSGNKSYFDADMRLVKLENEQHIISSINITYVGTSKLISSITDGVGRKYNFIYNASNLLTRINYVGSGTSEISYITFAYDSGNNLTSVTYPDGETVRYTYESKHLLTSAQDIDGHLLTFTYNNTSVTDNILRPSRVQAVAQSHNSPDEPNGGSLTFAYDYNQTTIVDNHQNKQIFQFNNMGNAISVYDGEGRAHNFQFKRNDPDNLYNSNANAPKTQDKANQMTLSSKLQATVGNYFTDSSFENDTIWREGANTSNVSISTTNAYIGNKSMQVISTAAQSQVVENWHPLEAGRSLTFSAYVKTESTAVVIGIGVMFGEILVSGETLPAGSDWTRIEVTYTNDADATIPVAPYIVSVSAGTYWVDCVQLESTSTASRYNLVENGDFRYDASGWSAVSVVYTPETATPQSDPGAAQLDGSPTAAKKLSQTVIVSGVAGDSFVISGWAKGNAAPLWKQEAGNKERKFALELIFNYTDNTTSDPFSISFNPDSDIWQYAANSAVAERAYNSVQVQIVYDYNVNTILCDSIQLFKEEFGNSYTYDANGNVISVADLLEQTTTYAYDGFHNLTQITLPSGAQTTYEYGAFHRLLSVTTPDGRIYIFTYDDYGNPTSVQLDSGNGYISESSVYSPDGNRLVKTVDTLGNETLYGYNADTNVLEWVQYPEDTELTRTNYYYDSMYRLIDVSSYLDTGSVQYALYTYNNDLLTGLSTPSTTYGFTYGDFGLRTAVTIGGQNLAEYSYTNDGKYLLSALDYGNGDSVNYTYDSEGRLTGETYEDGDTVSYAYNNSGDLATVTDSATGITTIYYYDLIDRLAKYRERGENRDHSVKYIYNSNGKLSQQEETINGTEHTTNYVYDPYNRLWGIDHGISGKYYVYDRYGRVSSQITEYNENLFLEENYTFKDLQPYQSTTQITSKQIDAAGYDVTFTYTYDDNGNILSVSDGTHTTTYVYDSSNQLIRENNPVGNFTYTWEYDGAGNILARNRYAYTTGELGSAITNEYTYGGAWGDLLASYNGFEFTYDEIGNLLSDNMYTYTWEHGRELATLFDGLSTWTYTYDANGMRTSASNGVTTYTYVYNGGSLSQMTVGNDTFYFTYDAAGNPMTVTYNGTVYYYVTNLQGDVIAILDSAGMPVTTYAYDAWGHPVSMSGSMVSTLGYQNPLRYRGYVYDLHSGFYYLQSRYYNPMRGRFINADALVSTGQGLLGNNMFAYCNNNPVNCVDPLGCLSANFYAVCFGGANVSTPTVYSDGKMQSDDLLQYVLDCHVPPNAYGATVDVRYNGIYSKKEDLVAEGIALAAGLATCVTVPEASLLVAGVKVAGVASTAYSVASYIDKFSDPYSELANKDYYCYSVQISWTQSQSITGLPGVIRETSCSSEILFLWNDTRIGNEHWYIHNISSRITSEKVWGIN